MAYSHITIILFYIQYCVRLNDLFLSLEIECITACTYHGGLSTNGECANSNTIINNVYNDHERMLHCLHFGVAQAKTLIVMDLPRMIIIFLEFMGK